MKEWIWVLLTVAAAGIGCSKRPAEPETADLVSDQVSDHRWLRVSTAEEEIEIARTISQRHEDDEEDLRLLQNPEQIRFVNAETEQLLTQHREQVIPRLVEVIESPGREFRERLTAGALLIRLGDERGREVLAAALRSADSEQLLAALGQAEGLHYYGRDSQPHVQLLLAGDGIGNTLMQLLDHPDPQVQKAAVQVIGSFDLPGHIEKFRALLHRSGYPQRGRIANWLADNGDPAVVMADIIRFFRQDMDGQDAYGTISAFDALAEKGDEQVRLRVMQLVREYYERDDIDRTELNASVDWRMTWLISKHARAESADWLGSVLPTIVPRHRGAVYEVLARLDADGWRSLLLEALSNEESPAPIARALGEKLAGSEDAEVTEALTAALERANSGSDIAALCLALLRVGSAAARATVEERLDQVDPWMRMELIWELRGITLDSARDQMVAAGIVTAEELDAAAEQLSDEEDSVSDRLIALLMSADRLLSFDSESGVVPCRHDQLLLRFAGISGGVFRPEHVSETWNQKAEDDYDADYTLRFVSEGRCYRAQLQDIGDWYDVERVVATANRALADAGHEERFVSLFHSGQVANFIFGRPRELARLAESLALPIADDPSRAMSEGQEFEQRVREQLQGEGTLVD